MLGIHELILTLGLKIILSEQPHIDCNYADNSNVVGCYKGYSKEVVVGYNSRDIDHTLYHEIGHALFSGNEEIRRKIGYYKFPRTYPEEVYNTIEKQIDESVADYYAMYRLGRLENDEIRKIFDEVLVK